MSVKPIDPEQYEKSLSTGKTGVVTTKASADHSIEQTPTNNVPNKAQKKIDKDKTNFKMQESFLGNPGLLVITGLVLVILSVSVAYFFHWLAVCWIGAILAIGMFEQAWRTIKQRLRGNIVGRAADSQKNNDNES